MEITPWLVGLDVGQVHDPSGLTIAQQRIEVWGKTR